MVYYSFLVTKSIRKQNIEILVYMLKTGQLNFKMAELFVNAFLYQVLIYMLTKKLSLAI